MTVSTTDNRVSYATDGSSSDYAVTYPFLAAEDLIVTFIPIGADPVVLSLGGDYTVTGGNNATGTVTTASVLASGGVLLVVRDVAFTQPTNYVNNDKTDAEVQERALDRGCMLSQQVDTKTTRAMRLNDAFTSAFDSQLPLVLTPGLGLKVNDAGDGFELGTSLVPTTNPGQFIGRTVFTAASLVSAGGHWTRSPRTGRIHVLLATGGTLHVSADIWVELDNPSLTTHQYSGWTLGDGGGAPGGNAVLVFTAGDQITVTTTVADAPAPDVGGAGNIVGWVFGQQVSTIAYLIIDEYTGSTYTTPG